jgi:hypothetical protein
MPETPVKQLIWSCCDCGPLLYYYPGARPAFHCPSRHDPRESSCVPAVKACANQAERREGQHPQKIPSSRKRERTSRRFRGTRTWWTPPRVVAQRTIAYRSRPLIEPGSFLYLLFRAAYSSRDSRHLLPTGHRMPFIVSSLRSRWAPVRSTPYRA